MCGLTRYSRGIYFFGPSRSGPHLLLVRWENGQRTCKGEWVRGELPDILNQRVYNGTGLAAAFFAWRCEPSDAARTCNKRQRERGIPPVPNHGMRHLAETTRHEEMPDDQSVVVRIR